MPLLHKGLDGCCSVLGSMTQVCKQLIKALVPDQVADFYESGRVFSFLSVLLLKAFKVGNFCQDEQMDR